VGDKIEKNEMGGACSAYGGGEKRLQVFGWRNQRERDHWGDRGVDGENNNKMGLQEEECWGMGWIELAQDRDRWRELVNAVMKLRVQ
jgi:hypothetical protein